MGKWNEALVAGLRRHDDLRAIRNREELEARKAQAKLTSEPYKHIPPERKHEDK